MATVTSSWHSLHLGMMSTFDILRPCPKIIISPLNSIASCCSPLAMNIPHHPPPFQSTPDFHLHLSFSLSLSDYSFIYPAFFLFSLYCPWSHLLLLRLQPVILFLSLPLQCNQPSWLILAESGLFNCSHNFSIIYLLFTLSLFPFSSSLPIYLSLCQLI